MAKTILESGTASSDGEVYYNHIMLMAKTLGTGETVAIEVADSKDDFSADASWQPSGVELDEETPVRAFFTSKGFGVRVTASDSTAIVAVDILNEPAEYRRATLGQ